MCALRARIPRMMRVGRRSVWVDWESRPVGVVERIVAFDAQRAQRAEPEGGVIALMGHDVVGYGRGCDVAGLQADPAQRLDA